jgi:hypothetical protein
VKLETDADLDKGEFGIATRLVGGPRDAVNGLPAEPVGGTMVYRPEEPEEPGEEQAEPHEVAAVTFAGEHHELPAHSVTLGRSKDCDIRLADPNVSRRHAEIRPDGEGWTVVDLGSTNGIEVDGKRVKELALQDGARFTLGTTEISFSQAAD